MKTIQRPMSVYLYAMVSNVCCLFDPSLSSCHEKVPVALYFGGILPQFSISELFGCFFDYFLPLNLLLV